MSLLWTLVALLLTGAVVWWAPGTRWANGSLVFQPGDTPPVKEAAKRLLSEYRRHVLLALAAAVLALLGFHWQLGESYARRLTVTIFALVCGALTWRVQWKMRDIRIVRAQHREAYLVIDELEELPRWPWLAATTVLVLSAIYLAALWQSIPVRFPVHWDLSGNANGWSVHTIWGVYRPLLLGLGLVAALYSMVHVGRWSLRRQWQTLDEETRDSNLSRLRVMTFTSTWVAVGLSALGLLLPFAGQPNLLAILAAVAAYLGGIAVIVVVCRPAWSRPRASRSACRGPSTPL